MFFRLLMSCGAMALTGAMACSSSNSEPTEQTGLQGDSGSAASAGAKNPYGVSYPSTNLGIAARAGNTPGNVMKNFKFFGYRTQPGSPIALGDLQEVSLSDYFDPELRNKAPGGSPYRVLHITVSSVWCTPCNEEAKETVAKAAELADKGVTFLTAIADGPIQGKPAERIDFDGWVKKHKANFTHVLDPSLTNFGSFFDAAAVPFNADVDVRSMEILYAGTGAPPDLSAHVEKWVKWTTQNPAQGASN